MVFRSSKEEFLTYFNLVLHFIYMKCNTELKWVKASDSCSYRSSRLQMFCKKGVLKNFLKFTVKQVSWNLSYSPIEKEIPAQIFPWIFYKIFKSNYSVEH